ncbi:MAG: type II toxin-antitoxin system VapC family toxin [Candidatus Rokubacteria bacterium]|nr:type II toxin-antitoxin system VapC family toxin [Candidatus Rokubacteria bacterium]
MKCLLDTNVYLEAVRTEARRSQFRTTFFPLLPATFLSAVVAYELSVNARERSTRTRLLDFVRPMERTGRLVTPSFDDWLEAAELVSAIGEGDRGWRSKLPALLNDILIALSARQIGATLFTYNREDFRLIRRYMDFSLRILEG